MTDKEYQEIVKWADKHKIPGTNWDTDTTNEWTTDKKLTKNIENMRKGIPRDKAKLETITHLNLEKLQSKLTCLPDVFGCLTSLIYLNISRNELLKLPESIENLTKLQYLNASHNGVWYESVEDGEPIQDDETVEPDNLDHRQKSCYIGVHLGKIINLKELDLKYCHGLQKFNIATLQNLEVLDIRGTGMEGVSVGISHLKNLKNLNGTSEFVLEYYTGNDNIKIPQNQTRQYRKKSKSIKNIILYGAPGVGKTHNYQQIISMIEQKYDKKEIFDTVTDNETEYRTERNNDTFKVIKDQDRVEFVTFHQSYSYEDFIEGFRPTQDGIELQNGIFKTLCEKASAKPEKNFYLVIDEINRGNISKIFGELITLIEEDKRAKPDEPTPYEITLPYSKESFKIPDNLSIIATMNSTDKSIATIDIALRRRFTFLKMLQNPNLVTYDKANNLMVSLNTYIKRELGEDYMLGHSYFMTIQDDEDLEFVKKYKIEPLLEEYFYADDDKLEAVLGILTKKEKNETI